MTEIKCSSLKKATNRYMYEIICKDHADGGPACAGISAIMQSLEGWLANFSEEGHYKADIKPGYAEIFFSGKEKTDAVYQMAVIGLKQIELGYPNACHVEIRDF